MNKQPKVTEQTKKNIVQAFWKLFKKKRLDQITVKEISDIAGYNRSTFYVYFTNIRDILEQEEEILLSYIQENTSKVLFPNLVKGMKPEPTQLFFYTKREYLKILLGENGDPQFLRKLKRTIFPVAFKAWGLQQDNSHDGYIFDFCFSAVLSSMLHWYEHDDLTIDELFIMIWRMLTQGILSDIKNTADF
ncbi:TetR/AcrR family transcriptional regulator [Clostridium sp. PL3]|uniref:TetR/AcrR family transcriptional regulator n=2 Tax=Clostridium thailandense TaxID=2794346 RepID=A0A949TVX1_9CLOT|nr:TetR/AcrR family transcriptional regulator [Clostridium thailandense]